MPEIDIYDDGWKITPTAGKDLIITLANGATLTVTGGNIEGAINATGTLTGTVTGNVTGGQILPAVTNYNGADAAGKAILPSVYNAHLTKATAGTDYTLAAPGAANVGHIMYVTSDTNQAHVVTVEGLLGGTTMTFGAAVGNGFSLLAVSATVWRVESSVGITQTA